MFHADCSLKHTEMLRVEQFDEFHGSNRLKASDRARLQSSFSKFREASKGMDVSHIDVEVFNPPMDPLVPTSGSYLGSWRSLATCTASWLSHHTTPRADFIVTALSAASTLTKSKLASAVRASLGSKPFDETFLRRALVAGTRRGLLSEAKGKYTLTGKRSKTSRGRVTSTKTTSSSVKRESSSTVNRVAVTSSRGGGSAKGMAACGCVTRPSCTLVTHAVPCDCRHACRCRG